MPTTDNTASTRRTNPLQRERWAPTSFSQGSPMVWRPGLLRVPTMEPATAVRTSEVTLSFLSSTPSTHISWEPTTRQHSARVARERPTFRGEGRQAQRNITGAGKRSSSLEASSHRRQVGAATQSPVSSRCHDWSWVAGVLYPDAEPRYQHVLCDSSYLILPLFLPLTSNKVTHFWLYVNPKFLLGLKYLKQ